ncbi:propionyl-CoA carboxylase beta chain mitochondrial precursor [Macrophomina phaseolina]|uniref:Propionyl-CoA carboxylase beta chain mitochondrial n=1 Tax=Macrophomina phaseolina TaxID=35725 RepID=A0ABQ8FXD8_9PEZI|nr:propionyl-CoA carboxylase beta chain mitochondrial precursor [Macrophomina phaseolina]
MADSSDNASQKRSSGAATERLAQVSNHLSPSSPSAANEKRPRRRRNTASDLPADYSDILANLSTLHTLANTPDPSHRGYARQKASGKLWVRERVAQLLDADSFREVGSASGDVSWQWDARSPLRETPASFTPSNNVQGFGALRGRNVLFTADDFSLRAGHADGALAAKTVYMEKLALALRLPMVKLVDGSSGGGSVTTIRQEGWSYVPPMQGFGEVVRQLNEGIPNLGAVLGPAIGLGAARVTACHFSVMARDVGALFNAGPKVVAGATFEEGLSFRDLGGPAVHCTNGTIDNLAMNEAECFDQLRTVLSFLPNSGTEVPPTLPNEDPVGPISPELRTVIPRKRERMYNPRKIITTVVDQGSWFEIGALWGTTAIVGLARIGGRPVGIVSLNCEVNAGALDAAGSQKITRHLKFLDIFNIPCVQFVDIPGYAVGTVAERTATMRHGVTLATTYYSTSIPIFSVIVRRVYGVAGGIMVDSRDPHMRVAWPSGEWGSLPLDGGIEAAHAHELKGIEKTGGKEKMKERYKELEQEYRRLMNPVRTANAFGIEEIVDPAVTRPLLAEWLRHVYDALLPIRVQQRIAGSLKPVFA